MRFLTHAFYLLSGAICWAANGIAVAQSNDWYVFHARENNTFLVTTFNGLPAVGDTVWLITSDGEFGYPVLTISSNNYPSKYTVDNRAVPSKWAIKYILNFCACRCSNSIRFQSGDSAHYFGYYRIGIPTPCRRPHSLAEIWARMRKGITGYYKSSDGERLAIQVDGDTIRVAYSNGRTPFGPVPCDSPNNETPGYVTLIFPGTGTRHRLQFYYSLDMYYGIYCLNPDGTEQYFGYDFEASGQPLRAIDHLTPNPDCP